MSPDLGVTKATVLQTRPELIIFEINVPGSSEKRMGVLKPSALRRDGAKDTHPGDQIQCVKLEKLPNMEEVEYEDSSHAAIRIRPTYLCTSAVLLSPDANDWDQSESMSNAKVRLIQLKKPLGCGSAFPKVTSCLVELLSGSFQGQRLTVANSNMYLWGHHLAHANLQYHLKYGDQGTLQFRVDQAGHLVVRALWLGLQSQKPVWPSDSSDLALWMANRGIEPKDWALWLKGELPARPYFPFISEVCQGRVMECVRQGSHDVVGVYVGIDTPESGSSSSSVVAILMQEDFYVCGVSVGRMDLRLLLRPGDTIFCQIQALSSSERRKMKKELGLKNDLEASHVAFLGYIGPAPPKSATLSTNFSPDLAHFLQARGFTVQDFHALSQSAPTVRTEEAGSCGKEVCDDGGQVEPAVVYPPNYLLPFLPTAANSKVMAASNLAAKAMAISTPVDVRVKQLLGSDEDVEIAVHLNRILNQALVLRMQSGAKPKSVTDSDLHSLYIQTTAAAKVLLPAASDASLGNGYSLPEKIRLNCINEKLKEVESKLSREVPHRPVGEPKPPGTSRDMRKVLQSYKASVKLSKSLDLDTSLEHPPTGHADPSRHGLQVSMRELSARSQSGDASSSSHQGRRCQRLPDKSESTWTMQVKRKPQPVVRISSNVFSLNEDDEGAVEDEKEDLGSPERDPMPGKRPRLNLAPHHESDNKNIADRRTSSCTRLGASSSSSSST